MIEDQLELARKTYLKTSVADYVPSQSWQDLQTRLGKQKHVYLGSYTRPLMVITILAIIVPLSAIQTAKPGQALYGAKLVADDFVAKISGKIEYKVQRRAQEVIDLSANDSSSFDQAASQYQESLEEAKKEAQESGRQEHFEQILEKQQQQFEKAIEKNPSAASHLEEAIKKTEEAKSQVKGTQDSPANQNGQNHDNSENRPQNNPPDNRGQDNHPESKGNPQK